jgi:hypothetical protein
VDQGQSVVVQGDSSVPAVGGRWERAELEQLGVLRLAAGSAAPVVHLPERRGGGAPAGSGARLGRRRKGRARRRTTELGHLGGSAVRPL